MSVKSEYKKIRQALLAQIRYLRKQGYTVDIDVPPIPRKITAASIRRIQKVKSTVREHTSYKGAKGFGAFRKRRQERAAERPPKPPKPPKEKGPQGPYVYGPDGTPAEQEPEEELGPEEGEEGIGPDVTEPEAETEPQEEFYPGQDGYDSIYPEDVPEGEGMPEGPDWWPPEGEIIMDNLAKEIEKGLNSKSKRVKDNAQYLLEELDKAMSDVDSLDQLMDNLAKTDPEAIREAQSILYYRGAREDDEKTHRFYELLTFGELLTEEEARRFDESFFNDQNEDDDYIDLRYGNAAYDNGWTEESWGTLPG